MCESTTQLAWVKPSGDWEVLANRLRPERSRRNAWSEARPSLDALSRKPMFKPPFYLVGKDGHLPLNGKLERVPIKEAMTVAHNSFDQGTHACPRCGTVRLQRSFAVMKP